MVLLGALAMGAVSFAQDSGLLLGLSDRNEGASTVFVNKKGVATFVREVGPGFWLWKDTGFMRVQPEGITHEGANSLIITSPNGEKSTIRGEDGRPSTQYVVSYVSQFGFGLLQNMSAKPVLAVGGTTAGGGLPEARFPSIYRNLGWTDLNTAVEVGQVFDEQTVKSFNDAAGVQPSVFGGEPMEREASPTNWTLRRNDGMWQLYGRVLPMQTSSRVLGHDFHVRPVFDPKLGATKAASPRWVRIRTEYPDAIDSTTSPDGKLTIIVTPDTVFVHESSGTSLGKRLQQIRVSSDRVVMTQWLEGDAIAKAAAAVGKL